MFLCLDFKTGSWLHEKTCTGVMGINRSGCLIAWVSFHGTIYFLNLVFFDGFHSLHVYKFYILYQSNIPKKIGGVFSKVFCKKTCEEYIFMLSILRPEQLHRLQKWTKVFRREDESATDWNFVSHEPTQVSLFTQLDRWCLCLPRLPTSSVDVVLLVSSPKCLSKCNIYNIAQACR